MTTDTNFNETYDDVIDFQSDPDSSRCHKFWEVCKFKTDLPTFCLEIEKKCMYVCKIRRLSKSLRCKMQQNPAMLGHNSSKIQQNLTILILHWTHIGITSSKHP